jgi:acetyl-CoA synthetase (ADP-forming)
MTRDDRFGPLLMVGLGGIFAEIVKDTVFRIAPVSHEDALAMLRDLVTWPILAGARGQKPADVNALAHIIVSLGELALRCERIREVDFNPVIVSEDGAIVADAKVILG